MRAHDDEIHRLLSSEFHNLLSRHTNATIRRDLADFCRTRRGQGLQIGSNRFLNAEHHLLQIHRHAEFIRRETRPRIHHMHDEQTGVEGLGILLCYRERRTGVLRKVGAQKNLSGKHGEDLLSPLE